MSYKILSARRVPSGPVVKDEQEVVDTAETEAEARALQKEYAVAFGDKVGVWIEDPTGKDMPVALSRYNCLRPGGEVL